jgi:hypothetical protein
MAKVGKIRRFDELGIFTKIGTVVGNQGRTASQTSAETSTTAGNYYVAPTTRTTVSTSTTHLQRLFVQQADGEEFDAEFADMDVGVREGHSVAVIYAGPQRTGRGYPMALVNLTSRKHQMFPKRVNWILSSFIKPLLLGWGALLVLLLVFSRGNLGGISIPLLLIVGGILAWEVFRWLSLYRQVRLEIDGAARAILNNRGAG